MFHLSWLIYKRHLAILHGLIGLRLHQNPHKVTFTAWKEKRRQYPDMIYSNSTNTCSECMHKVWSVEWSWRRCTLLSYRFCFEKKRKKKNSLTHWRNGGFAVVMVTEWMRNFFTFTASHQINDQPSDNTTPFTGENGSARVAIRQPTDL